MRYGMVIDTSRCVACHACEVACKSANNVPVGVFWNRVLTDGGSGVETLAGEYPNGTISVMTISCQHCENCLRKVSRGATYKIRDWRVRQNHDKCIGCRMCAAACPYTGVVHSIGMNPNTRLTLRRVTLRCLCTRRRLRNVPSATRGDAGSDASLHGALSWPRPCWGDLDDPESEVSKPIASRSTSSCFPKRDEALGVLPGIALSCPLVHSACAVCVAHPYL
ncbi:MAG: 4Fe-4S binding protein [Coriobacteriaceae bacterium]